MAAEINLDLNNEEIQVLVDICRRIGFNDLLPLVDCPREAYQGLRGFFHLQIQLENHIKQQLITEEPRHEH